MIQRLRYLFAAYMRDIPHPNDLYDSHGAEIAFGENGMPAWNPDDVLKLDGNSALLTVTRRFLVADEDRDKTAEWVRGFAKYAGVRYEDLAVSTVRDKGADFDIEVKAHLSLLRVEGNQTRNAPAGGQMARDGAISPREALVQCELFLGNVSRHGHPTLCPGDKCTACEGVDELRGMVVRALAAPRRNCDVGTASEQKRRFNAFCTAHVCCTCRLSSRECNFQWGQLPYDGEAE